MRIDALGLQAFIAIADTGSFLAAAERLHLSQTALSHRMTKLENELGVALFARTTRRLALTQEGLALLPRARRALGELESVLTDLRQLGDLRKRELTMGCVPSVAGSLLPDLLHDFSQKLPDVRVRILDGYAHVIATQVNTGQAEFGLIVRRSTHFELDFLSLVEEAFVAVCTPDHPLASKDGTTWEELRGTLLIGNSVAGDALRDMRDAANWHYRVENISTALSFVRRGMGVSVIPALMRPQIERMGLCTLPISSPQVTRTIGIVTRPDMPPSRQAKVMMELIANRMKELTDTGLR
ncbi:LysR family transcriptional regulator [Halodurantibacterium flavum]|uniref:LysR family transcriptional regulator n=1 Tax=Halodurantibacterium flavum TaxID=1382802 RepID=A0ABW4S0H1_9RHOB